MPAPPELSGLTPEAKRRLLEQLLAKRPGAGEDDGPRPVPRTGFLPLSSAQERVCFLAQFEGAASNARVTALRMQGVLDRDALSRAVTEAVRRHEVLRTTVHSRNGHRVQQVESPFEVSLPLEDLSALPEDEREATYRHRAQEEERRAFNLSSGPLLRLSLLRLSAQEHLLLLTVATVVLDGADSLTLLLAEVAALYGADVEKRPAELPEPSLQFADFAVWERGGLDGPRLLPHLDFWKKKLADAPGPLPLPVDRHPNPPTQERAWLLQPAPREAVEALRALCRTHHATLYMALQAAFAALLQRFTGQTDLLLGVTTDGRPHPRVKRMIGCFYNLAVSRLEVSGNPDFVELLARARAATLELLPHAEVPFEKVVEAVKPPRAMGLHPLVQVTVTMMRGLVSDVPWPTLRVRHELFDEGFTTEALHLKLIEQEDGGLDTLLEYRADLFERTTAEGLLGGYHALLEAVAKRPETRLAALPVWSASLRNRVLREWNQTEEETEEVAFAELFEAQAERTPEAIAVEREGGEAVTYRELNERANRWAHALRERGVGQDSVVPLLEGRGPRWLTGVLAIFKAGGAYLPMDPEHPGERYLQVLEQVPCRFVLCAREWKARLGEALDVWPAEKRPQVLDLEDLSPGEDTTNPPRSAGPGNLAYVLFTSGSTGKPKGAMLEHRGMVNHLWAKVRELSLSSTDVVAQTASQCFDISVWQNLAALVVGGKTVIFPDEVAQEARPLLRALEQHRVSVVEVVPSLLRALLEEVEGPAPEKPALAKLRWMVATGEALAPDLCARWLRAYPGVPLVNAYGPTECSDDVTHHVLRAPPETVNTPIGRPILNTRAYVLEVSGEPVPPGVPGELFIAGAGVGRGYLGRPDLTAERFVPDPFSTKAGGRLYRTGDQARFLSNGTLEYLGRLDHQVKLRGFRIELGEIEYALRALPGVRDAVVLAREDTPGHQRLVAYVVLDASSPSASSPSGDALRDALRHRLPKYMVPAAFVLLPALPLTSNGKVDRSALPPPDVAGAETPRDATLPRDALEERLACAWAELLSLPQVGIHEDVFALGAHSLLAMRLVSLVRETLGVSMSVRDIFVHPTVALLASHLRPGLGASTSPSPAGAPHP